MHKLALAAVRSLLGTTALVLSLPSIVAQETPVGARITQPIIESQSAVLKGNTHPLARSEFDQGAASPNLPMDRMLLVLRRSPAQDAALQLLLQQQQDKASPNYHAWLTPEQLAQQFGPADSDVQTITAWLTSNGFKVNRVARGKAVIEFSGTAGQVNQAFHTEIHSYRVNGKTHWANSSDPHIPQALTSVVAGVTTLHNFVPKPQHRIVSAKRNFEPSNAGPITADMNPLTTYGGSGCGLAGSPCYAVSPYDLATIYNALPLWNAKSPIDGTGQTIAIVSQTDIYPQDFSGFRQAFGLPRGTLNIIYDGVSPGKLASQGDELEADVDVQWSGAVAKGAVIDLVVSASTNTTAGLDLSALYIVDNNIAPILSESYGACELEMGTTANQFYYQLWQQAAAEGISVFVSTGDSGSAVCDQNVGIPANGLTVNGIASTPYNVAVGGTDFADFQNISSYWNSTNDPVTRASAKGYIPESTWNDTCTNSEFFVFSGDSNAEEQCNDSGSRFWPAYLWPVGGSGGASNCTTPTGPLPSNCSGGYTKPSWQAGSGVPSDGKRDVPDVSLFAADGLNSSFYTVCETDIYGGCGIGIGGTSVSSPAFAGIMALINQKTQSRQGNPNYHLYALAAQPGASCDSSALPASTCIFNDITAGTIAMPCMSGSPDCTTTNSVDLFGVLSGYATTNGYDLATGLGTVNIANLVNNWNAVSFTPTVSTLSLSPTSITHGAPVDVNVLVSPQTGSGTPSGMASLLTSTGKPAGTFTLSGAGISATTTALPGGSYTVSAHYAGDGTFAASDSSPGIPVVVNPEPSTTTLQALTFDQHGTAHAYTSGPYGTGMILVRATVAGQSGQGIPGGTVNLTEAVNGTTTPYPGNPYPLSVHGYTIADPPNPPIEAYPPGNYTVRGDYGGDPSFNASTSTTTFTVTQAPTTPSISAIVPCPQLTPCSVSAGTQVIIFASVYNPGSAVGNLPTGTVTFYSNGAALGPPVSIDSNIIPPVASINTQLPSGADNITVQYSGDANYLGSTSAPTLVSVGQTFSLTATPGSITVSPGKSGSATVMFTAQNGFSGTATLTGAACSGLPAKSTCSFSPSMVSLNSNNTNVPVTLTITTTAPSSRTRNRAATRQSQLALWISGTLAFGVCLVSLTPRRRRLNLSLFMVLVVGGAISCGGGASTGGGNGGGGAGGGGSNDPGTPVGTYNVIVTVTINGVSQSINNLTLSVQ